jgi:hypothetical protein
MYSLGVASLRNYQKLTSEWFDKRLTDYNFYIMPLGFAYNFQTLQMLDLDTQPEIVSNLVQSAINSQTRTELDENYHFLCEIKTTLVSAKRVQNDTDFVTKLVASIDEDEAPDSMIVTRTQPLTDKYPYSYARLAELIRKAKPGVTSHHINKVIRDFNIKLDPRFSAYNFRNKDKQKQYEETGILPSNTPSIYNNDAVRFIVEEAEKYL